MSSGEFERRNDQMDARVAARMMTEALAFLTRVA
jgi:hypothetical protein